MNHSVFIGWDAREAAAFAVARHSVIKNCITPIPVYGLILSDLIAEGLFWRPTSMRDGRIWDEISQAPCATEFSNTRFLVPEIVRRESKRRSAPRWALFMDCDMLVRSNMEYLFSLCDSTKAVMVVKHDFRPANEIKMDNQSQTKYSKKLWSSFCIYNVDHPSNAKLTPELVNSVPGRDLHGFCWLKDEEIGELDASWNWIPGHSNPDVEPDCIHWSEGGCWFPGYETVPYATEWKRALERWAA